jgi:positive regulator of sigma E activity
MTNAFGLGTILFAAPSPPASVAEGLIGVALAVAAVTLVRAPSLRFAWIAYVFALGGTLLGLSIILASRIGGPDLWVHFVMLAGVAAGFALLAGARGPIRSI